MNLNIRIALPAWTWVNSTVDIITGLFSELGYDLITDIEYESRIKWWVNFFDVHISDTWEKYLTNKVDIILAFNDESLIKQIPFLKPHTTIIVNKKWTDKINAKDEKLLSNLNILDLEIADKYDNTYLLWMFVKFLNLDLEIILWKIEEIFARKWEEIVQKNQDIVKNIFDTFEIKEKFNLKIEKVWKPKNTTYGNKALTYGAIEWELWYYAAYPMTPASSILTEVINYKKIPFLQAEDEIAVANSTLGASFTWTRAMCGTSGGWFSLMSEAISFSAQAEIPLTIVLSQRAGPSTGTPTFTEQWDMNFAMHPTFGDFNHVVLYPSTLEEAHYFWCLALNIADKYQTQVIILMDKQSSELVATHDKMSIPKVDRWVILDHPPEDYKRYELNESWISPRVKVGTKHWDFIASSYEHDEYWATSEDPEEKKLFTEKRFKKIENFFEKEWYKWYEVINPKAKKMLITISFTSYTANHFIEQNPEYGLIIIKFLKHLDERLLEDIKDKEEIIFVEKNYSGQLENHIVKELWLKHIKWLKVSNLRKYDLMPFYIEDFEELK